MSLSSLAPEALLNTVSVDCSFQGDYRFSSCKSILHLFTDSEELVSAGIYGSYAGLKAWCWSERWPQVM
jgi:hypothetical protein